MSWRGPEYDGDFPSLGWEIVEWIEEFCVIPDREQIGEPYVLTDEQVRFLVHHYRVREDATGDRPASAFQYRRSQLVRPQKWGKGPLTAAMVCAEAVGPALFDGWDAHGDPVGRPWATPKIQITATSEDQTDNVFGALVPMIEHGPLSEYIPDVGKTRILLPGGGDIYPVTSKATSRLGQRVTFVIQDETQLWKESNKGWHLASTQRRGLAGMGGRSVETTNAWDKSENSVAQRTFESKAKDIYRDFRQAPANLSYGNKRERAKIHRSVYGDSWWVDMDRIESEAAELLETSPAEAERFFGNRPSQGVGAWMPTPTWEAGLRTLQWTDGVPPPGTPICLGFDGSESNDWTAIVGITMDGTVFVPTFGPDNQPTWWNPDEFDGKIPRDQVDAAVDELFEKYDIGRMYCDPQDWRSEIGDWAVRHGSEKVFEWATNRIKQMHEALKTFDTNLRTSRVGHSGDKHLGIAVSNARRLARPGQRWILGKATETQKIDLAMAMVIAHEAWVNSLGTGWGPTTKPKAVVFGRRTKPEQRRR